MKTCSNPIDKISVADEFDFGDERVNNRCYEMLDCLSNNSEKTLRQAFSYKKDYKAALRFFDSNLVNPESILTPHFQATAQRCEGQNLVTVIQDSSDLDFDYLKIEDFESMSSNVDYGYRIHPSLVTTESGVPLGLMGFTGYTRDTKKERKHRNCLPIEKKESFRWLEGYHDANELAQYLGKETTVVSISDREGDIYEVLAEAEGAIAGEKAHVLTRAQHNRILDNEHCVDLQKLEQKLHRESPVAQGIVKVNKGRKNERSATVNIRATSVSIKAPATANKKGSDSLHLNIVLVSEVDPIKLRSEDPKDLRKASGDAGLYWVLISTLPIDTVADVKRIVRLYSIRWQIEVYFKVLKSGCGIHRTYLKTKERIENFIAFSFLVAWRVMLITYLSREHPNIPCTVLFTDIEWKLAYLFVHDKAVSPPKKPIDLKEMTSLIAQLGGYSKRKTPPGVISIWRGLSKLFDILHGHEITMRALNNL